jgi:hypothetical protein
LSNVASLTTRGGAGGDDDDDGDDGADENNDDDGGGGAGRASEVTLSLSLPLPLPLSPLVLLPLLLLLPPLFFRLTATAKQQEMHVSKLLQQPACAGSPLPTINTSFSGDDDDDIDDEVVAVAPAAVAAARILGLTTEDGTTQDEHVSLSITCWKWQQPVVSTCWRRQRLPLLSII